MAVTTDGQRGIWQVPPNRRPTLLPIGRQIGPFVNPYPTRFLPHPNIITRRTRPLVSPPVRTVYKPSPEVRAVIDSLSSAVDSNDKDVAVIVKEIIRVLGSFRAVSVSRRTRAVIDTFVTGKPLEVGFKQSVSTTKAEVITKALTMLNSLSGEQIVTLKTDLSRKFGLNYKAEVLTEPTLPPKYETPPEVQAAYDNILIALKSMNNKNVNSEKILSDIIKFATSAEVNSVVPSYLSSSAKIVVDAYVSNRSLKPDHPSASILEALRTLPNDQIQILMDQFLKVIAMNPQSDMGIIDGVSNIVLEEKNVTEAMIRQKQIAEAEKNAAEQARKNNQERIFQLELEQKQRVDQTTAEQLRRFEEQNKRFAEEASRKIGMLELENQRRMEAENERFRRLQNRNENQFQAYRKHTEVINSLPVDIDRELFRMNADLLQTYGPEARKWLENVKKNVTMDTTTIVDSQIPQSDAYRLADNSITGDNNLVAEGPRTVPVTDRDSGLGGNGIDILSPRSTSFVTPLADRNPGSGGNGIDILSPRSNNVNIDVAAPSSGNIVIQPQNNIRASSIRNRINILPSTTDNRLYPMVPSTVFNLPSQTAIRQRLPEWQYFNTIPRVQPTRRLIRIRRPTSLRLLRNRFPTRNFDSRFRPIYFQ